VLFGSIIPNVGKNNHLYKGATFFMHNSG
jgi:hypothetical protein